MSDCKHENVELILSATTSVMAVTFQIFGAKCKDCGTQWDVGDLLEGVVEIERLKRTAAFWEQQAQLYKEGIDELMRFPNGRHKAVTEVIGVAKKLKQMGLLEKYKSVLLDYLGYREQEQD
jgi:hypothetical protein